MSTEHVLPAVSNRGDNETVPQLLAVGVEQDTQQQQVVTFVDNTPVTKQVFESVGDPTYVSDALPDSSLSRFLERPVLISTQRWTEGTPYGGATINPWHAFFTHPIIKKKIDNFAFVNCRLHIKAVINASPFYYGAKLVAYRPLQNYGIPDNSFGDIKVITHSQRPHFWILPQSNTGGEMILPFFYPDNWLPLTDTTALSNMGQLVFTEVVQLANANSVSGNGIDIQFYAWAEDVHLAGPTYELQSGKRVQKSKRKQVSTRRVSAHVESTSEYEQGPVEKVASAVANVATRLADVPVIGPFAKATEYGAKAISGIASLFGWTNVPVISDVEPLKNVPFHGFSSAEIGTPVEKLTLDPKNELTIDPRTVGLQGHDELDIASFAGRESYLTQFSWNETQATGNQLFIARVNPTLYYESSVSANASNLGLTPMALVADAFKYWRGDIIFRFKAICTQYHKGRLRITWDPLTDLNINSDTTETSFTKIVDLAPDMDIEIRVSYLQKRVYLETRGLNVINYQTSTFNLQPEDYTDNGTLSVRILNDLTGPATGASVSILVFVRAAENISFTNPKQSLGNSRTLSYFEIQSGTEVSDASMQEDSQLTSIISGEAVKSLRVLMRRTNLTGWTYLEPYAGDGSSDFAYYRVSFQKLPEPYGYLPSAPNNAINLNTLLSVGFSFGRHNTISTFLPCFIGYRGSTMIHLNAHSMNKIQYTMLVQRREDAIPNTVGKVDSVVKTLNPAGTNWGTLTAEILDQCNSGQSGMALTNQATQTGMSVLCPHYYNNRFADTNPHTWWRGSTEDGSSNKHYELLMIQTGSEDADVMKSMIIQKYISIGPDFQPFFFLNVPMLYRYASTPAPAA